MKRYGYLKEKICTFENCKNAIWKASKGKRGRKSVQEILANIDTYALMLKELLETETFTPSPYTKRIIYDTCCHKEREITIPKFFPDQCVHWALMLQIEPCFMRGMYKYSCACVRGRGQTYGKKYIERIRRKKNTKYTFNCDIYHFYPSIPHRNLIYACERLFKDRFVIALIAIVVRSCSENGIGIAIGIYLSQWLANFYLQGLDHYVKENLGIHHYVRYADNMPMLDGNLRRLRRGVYAVMRYLSRLKLELKSNWQIWRTWSRPLDFLGYKFYKDKTTLRGTSFLRIRRHSNTIAESAHMSLHAAQQAISYSSRFRLVNCDRAYEAIISPLNLRRCRNVISCAARRENAKKKKATAS